MAKAKKDQVLGLNARNFLYLAYNSGKGRKIADSKLLTKRYLKRAGLPSPGVFTVFKQSEDIFKFAWESLPDNFVLKPSHGFGGEGIVIVKKKAKWAGEWRLMDDSLTNTGDLRSHALAILSGQYSLGSQPDAAFIEERIKITKAFRKYAYKGTPDIRIIVFNKVPVLAMLRLPTPKSEGKSNLHQGAIAVGIDLATGVTTHGIWQGQFLKKIPGYKRKINGLKLPLWDTIMTLAVRAQETVPSLGYLGVDIVYDKAHGPVILELNARPGLEIQNANLVPLRKRLERVEGLEIKDATHGVRIARALFAERFADRVMIEEGIKTLNISEQVKVRADDGTRVPVSARIDTGAFRSSIDQDLAQQLGLLKTKNILWRKGEKYAYRSVQGRQSRAVIGLTLWLAGRKIKTSASVADRSKIKHKILIGRNDLGGFLVRTQE